MIVDEGLLYFHIGLFATIFLLVLNGHLRRRNKVAIDVALGVIWIMLWLGVFIFFGWVAAVAALVLSFVYALAAKPVAVSVARRVLGYFTTFQAPGTSSGSELSGDALRAYHEETQRRLKPLAQRPSITKVLSRWGMKADDLREQFEFLLDIGLGAVARDIISHGGQLDRLLKLRQRKLPPEKIALRLMLWRWHVLVLCIGALDAAGLGFLNQVSVL